METQNLHKTILERKDRIAAVSNKLKQEFIGLELIIDEVLDLLLPWYLFPDAQMRPTIINLWGLTGSGKTALVRRIVELLHHKRLFVQMDMGEFESDSASWLKGMFTDDLAFFDGQPGIICLDEFQFAKTMDKNGQELGKDKLRVVWDILDSGKINHVPYQNSYYMLRADLCMMYLLKCEDKGVVIRDGVVVEKEKEFLETFSEYYFESATRYGETVNTSYFLSRDFVDGLFYLANDTSVSREKVKEKIEQSDNAALQRLIIEGANKRNAVKQLDLSKCLMFVLGNLDEAYYMSHSLNPDINADELHEATCKINIADIKRALQERFRNEQIARLGNNHVIYRSFTKQNFRDIIAQKLNELKAYVLMRFGYTLMFDETVIDIVYAEGVFPAQGTRPLFTTIKNLVEGNISKVVLEIIQRNAPVAMVKWHYQDETFIFSFMNSEGLELFQSTAKLILKIGSLRKPVNENLQAHTAVHESGHAILAALTLRIIPSLVVSRTASANSEGFCMVNMPEGPITLEVLKKEIMIGLGGYVAEKLIFGEGNTCSGVAQDIERVSEMANRAIKEYAMGQDPIFIRFAYSQDNLAIAHQEKHTEETLKLIRECEAEAQAILNKNKLLLLKMSQFLTFHSRLEEKDILNMVCEFSAEEWVSETSFVKKEQYFKFAAVINEQLKNLPGPLRFA